MIIQVEADVADCVLGVMNGVGLVKKGFEKRDRGLLRLATFNTLPGILVDGETRFASNQQFSGNGCRVVWSEAVKLTRGVIVEPVSEDSDVIL
jgi:hypothetical protein